MPIRQGKVALSDGYDKLAAELKALDTPQIERPRLGFVVLILVLVLVCVGLGTWQMMRLAEKEAQIARIEDRADQPSSPLPAIAEWTAFDPEAWDYRRTTLSGTFVPEQTILVFTSLEGARGPESGPGYWVLTPLVRSEGGTVWVNRGFIPDRVKRIFADGGAPEPGQVSVSGLMRKPEAANAFTPGTDMENRVEWIRNPARFSAISDAALAPVLDAYLDADANVDGGLPQGGETKFDLPNRHFEYALTWYGLAAAALAMLGVWLFGRRKA